MTSVGVALDSAALRRFMDTMGLPVLGDLRVTPITGGRSNLTYKISDDHQAWVLRRPPIAGLSPSAHDVAREFRIVQALQSTGVPVARTAASCTDLSVIGAPFTLVGFVPGRVLQTQDELDAVSDRGLAAIHRDLIRVLAQLHNVPYLELGLKEFGRPEGFVPRQVERWRQQWEHVATRELVDVDTLYRQLRDRPPRQGRATIVHGDYRIDNTLLDRDGSPRILALVDWEMSTLGDPLTDVAMMCAYQHSAFDQIVGAPAASTSTRWPDVATIAQDYAESTDSDLAEFEFYLGLAFFKLAVIAEGIASRHLAGSGAGPGFATAGNAVPGLLAAGLSALGASL